MLKMAIIVALAASLTLLKAIEIAILKKLAML